MILDSLQKMMELADRRGCSMWQLVLETDMENRMIPEEASRERMRQTWQAMVDASDHYDGKLRSLSGLVGGDGQRVRDYYKTHRSIGGDFTTEVISEALAMGESNACMRRIVAAPTAGACGVLPAVLLPLWRKEHISEENIIEGLYLSAGIGSVLAARASISGAAGGCQAEIGSASAMAAGATAVTRCACSASSPQASSPLMAAQFTTSAAPLPSTQSETASASSRGQSACSGASTS